jgi:hypothetical protein
MAMVSFPMAPTSPPLPRSSSRTAAVTRRLTVSARAALPVRPVVRTASTQAWPLPS